MRIAICCDQDVPSELLRNALTIGRAVTEKGHTAFFIVGDPVTLVDYAGGWMPSELFQGPVRRPAPHLVMKRPSIDGFADYMAVAGFDDKETLLTLSTIWKNQLQTIKPDIVLSFYTPVLWLVAAVGTPTFALGNGFVLPPILDTTFPRMSVDSIPVADERVMLANANAVLARLGAPSLPALSDVLSRCTPILYGPPTFDPYIAYRRTMSNGLLGERPSLTVPPAEQRFAAFLDVYCPKIETIVLALASFSEHPIDVFIAGATKGMRTYLEQHEHVTVWNDHAALLSSAGKASVLIHHGAQDVAQRSISLGRPQLLIPWTREQTIFAYSVGWMNFSQRLELDWPVERMVGAFRTVLKDTSLVIAAQHHARQLANSNLPDALPHIIGQIEANLAN